MFDIQPKVIFEKTKHLLSANIPTNNDELQTFVNETVEVLKYHEWRYYVIVEPIIGDTEYDELYKKLESIELSNPDLILADSPTQRVSNDLKSDMPSVNHLESMLSLDNSYNLEDLENFDKRIKKLCDLPENEAVEYVVEPKYDGGSIALVFENDTLTRAATRGNGTQGEEITANARTIKSIPQKANFSSFGINKVELRGEVLIRKDIFEKLNEERKEAGKDLYANARNTATGGLRTKTPQKSAERKMDAFIYQLGYTEGDFSIKNHHENIEVLSKLGFKVPTVETKVCKNIKEVHDFCKMWEEKRDSYNYEIDGMVVKVNSLNLQDQCGQTNHHPRWAIAFKFKAKQATSILETVEYQIGKTGSITPVAKIKPVQLAGVTVSSISLHNEDFIQEKDIMIGDTVVVERAGDVIPYIASSMSSIRNGEEQPIEFPKNCPSCETVLTRVENEAAWRCPNVSGCPAQQLQRIIFHVSKPAMDIDGFGKSNVERFFELGYLNSIADVYRLPFEEIEKLEGFGARSIEKLRNSIEKAKLNPLHRLLVSLSVHHLGKKASKIIASKIKSIFDLTTINEEWLTEIKDIGPILAKNVISYFHDENNIQLLRQLEELGVNTTQLEADQPVEIIETDHPFSGKTILFTGALQQLKRKEAQEKALSVGAIIASSVNKKLNILVVGEKAGSKLKKAQELGSVEIITEADFIEQLK